MLISALIEENTPLTKGRERVKSGQAEDVPSGSGRGGRRRYQSPSLRKTDLREALSGGDKSPDGPEFSGYS